MMFLFKFCPHSVLSSYLFTGSRSYFFFFSFLHIFVAELFFSHLFGVTFSEKVSFSGIIWVLPRQRARARVVWIEEGSAVLVHVKWKGASVKYFFAQVVVRIFFSPHTFFSVRCRKFSSDTDVFSEAVLCGYYPPACQSPCPVKGCRCKAKEYQWI